jgi:hypothetical protein
VERQRDAALDQQRLAPAGLDARSADGPAGGLVAAHQHGRVEGAVQGLDLREMRHGVVAKMVSVGLGADPASLGQFSLGAGDANVKGQGGIARVGHAGLWLGL